MNQHPRILFVIPDVLFIPKHSTPGVFSVNCRTECRSDCLAFLASDLYYSGVDVHVVQPAYRNVFALINGDCLSGSCSDLPGNRVHLAQDRSFYYAAEPQNNSQIDNIRISITLQREVLHQWIGNLQPDLVHCYDWMCGLIPAACRKMNIPSVFSLIEADNQLVPLWLIEDLGIDAAQFWDRLFYNELPGDRYEDTRHTHSVDMLLSGMWSATYLNIMRYWALRELAGAAGSRPKGLFSRILREKFRNQRVAPIFEEHFSTRNYIDLYESILNQPLVD